MKKILELGLGPPGMAPYFEAQVRKTSWCVGALRPGRQKGNARPGLGSHAREQRQNIGKT